MPVDPQKELTRLHGALGISQAVIKSTFFEWRQTALELLGPGSDPLNVVLKFWEIAGIDVAKGFFPMLDLRKGEEGVILDLGRALAGTGIANGAVVTVEKGEAPFEALIRWHRCPWPTFARRYGVSMKEDLLGCDRFLQTIVAEANALLGTDFKIETQKAIPSGDGLCLRRLFK